jgi:hypothetical protein
MLTQANEHVRAAQLDLEKVQADIGKPFTKMPELAKKQARSKELEEILKSESQEAPTAQYEDEDKTFPVVKLNDGRKAYLYSRKGNDVYVVDEEGRDYKVKRREIADYPRSADALQKLPRAKLPRGPSDT